MKSSSPGDYELLLGALTDLTAHYPEHRETLLLVPAPTYITQLLTNSPARTTSYPIRKSPHMAPTRH